MSKLKGNRVSGDLVTKDQLKPKFLKFSAGKINLETGEVLLEREVSEASEKFWEEITKAFWEDIAEVYSLSSPRASKIDELITKLKEKKTPKDKMGHPESESWCTEFGYNQGLDEAIELLREVGDD